MVAGRSSRRVIVGVGWGREETRLRSLLGMLYRSNGGSRYLRVVERTRTTHLFIAVSCILKTFTLRVLLNQTDGRAHGR